MRTDGRTDIPKLLATFRNFVNTIGNIYKYQTPYVGRDNTVDVATFFGYRVQNSKPDEGETIRTHPDLPWTHPAVSTMG
jgi:hypothetical protein